jgi:hypothetical protein
MLSAKDSASSGSHDATAHDGRLRGGLVAHRLLWVLALSTAALVLFHELGARMGVVTGQGMAGLMRERYGVRWAAAALLALVGANVGTTCASSPASRRQPSLSGSAAT